MRKTNLLYIITKLELGGAQKQLLSLISHLDKERYNLFLFTAYEGLLIPDFSALLGLKIKRSKFIERSINFFNDSIALFEIYYYIKKNNIDIVHTHSSKAGILGRIAAKIANVKIIIHTVHGWSFNDYQCFSRRQLFIWLERLTARFTQQLIVVSRYDKQKGLSYRIGNEKKYSIINYSINYEEFKIQDKDIRNELGINSGDLVIGMVSCFKPQKSPQDFIKLAYLIHQKLPNIKFILVGDGVLRKNIERLIRNHHLQSEVILTGWRVDIPRILSALDVFLLTSRWEGLPITVLEAMASAKPVIVTNTGGVSEVINEGETGFLVPPGNLEEMLKKATILLSSEELREKIGQNARASLGSNFTLIEMAKKTQDLYSNLIKN
jgi:glycosyltransferase involved in cell wall biosynthesis